jgi:hypothetical protein
VIAQQGRVLGFHRSCLRYLDFPCKTDPAEYPVATRLAGAPGLFPFWQPVESLHRHYQAC